MAGKPALVEKHSEQWPPMNPVLHYMAILRAARDFGLSPAAIEHVARGFSPLTARPRELADALADALAQQRPT